MTKHSHKPPMPEVALQRARELRHDSTLPERVLWALCGTAPLPD